MAKYKKLTAEERKEKNLSYEKEIADLFIEGIEKGTVPWRKPWNPGENVEDFNMFSMKKKDKDECYKGINSLICELVRTIRLNSDDPRWTTFVNLQEYNSKIKDEKEKVYIKKGESGTAIKFFKPLYLDENGKKMDSTSESFDPSKASQVKPVLQHFFIWNVSQLGKYTYDENNNIKKDENGNFIYRQAFEPYDNGTKKIEVKPLIEPETLIKKTKANVEIDQIDRCFYSPSEDKIHMVAPSKFETMTDYYDTLLHELTHWTGNPKRLDREDLKTYGTSKQSRAREELVAEIGGYMLCKETKIAFKPSDNNLAYVQSWVQYLKDKPENIFEACKQAKKATDYITDLANKNTNSEKLVITKIEDFSKNKGKGRT